MRKPDTLREAYVQASSFLQGRGIQDARSNAELLLQHLFGWTRSQLLLHWSEPFPEERVDEWEQLVERKSYGEPVQYMMGETEFYGLPFYVTPAVLIPRPETELLVEAVVARGKQLWPDAVGETADRGQGPLAVDIGTGSGAIAVSLARRCPGWRIAASDLSAPALAVARRNAERNGVAERIEWKEGDLLGPFLAEGRTIDVLVSNPPYIRDGDIDGLQPEVKFYEPKLALAGGQDGLDCYRNFAVELKRLPALPRLVAFEVGMGQAQDVAALLRGVGTWDELDIVRDYAGIERHVIALRRQR